MVPRTLASQILSYAKKYPVVTLTGPRQSGKTTLSKMLFPKKSYYSMEDLDVRERARRDPRSFLEECAERGAVLDEIQRSPSLLSYLQTFVDQKPKPGLFILTGSQNFELLNFISQTLAGRTALATLLPFSYEEIRRAIHKRPLDQILYAGFYPRLHHKRLNPTEALSFYVSTYLERDIRSLVNVKDLAKFELFLRLCASRTGRILNVASLGNDCGVNHNTAKSWLSVLEASYIIHFARPYHRNFRKRLVKSSKLYFVDVGLAAYLVGIDDPKEIAHHPLKGALFETFAVGEILKGQLNRGKRSHLYYFRDNIGNEVDLILEEGSRAIPVEIKLGKTVADDFFKGLRYYRKLDALSKGGFLIYGGERSYQESQFKVVSFRELAHHLPL